MPTQKTTHSIETQAGEELGGLVETRVLAYVDEPTDWANQMAVGTIKDERPQICIDPQFGKAGTLPASRARGHLLEQKSCSKVDFSHGYWHWVLQEDYSVLATFSTPFG